MERKVQTEIRENCQAGTMLEALMEKILGWVGRSVAEGSPFDVVVVPFVITV